jgi:hypothetical protein
MKTFFVCSETQHGSTTDPIRAGKKWRMRRGGVFAIYALSEGEETREDGGCRSEAGVVTGKWPCDFRCRARAGVPGDRHASHFFARVVANPVSSNAFFTPLACGNRRAPLSFLFLSSQNSFVSYTTINYIYISIIY